MPNETIHDSVVELWEAFKVAKRPTEAHDNSDDRRLGFQDGNGHLHTCAITTFQDRAAYADQLAKQLPDRVHWQLIRTAEGRRLLFSTPTKMPFDRPENICQQVKIKTPRPA